MAEITQAVLCVSPLLCLLVWFKVTQVGRGKSGDPRDPGGADLGPAGDWAG